MNDLIPSADSGYGLQNIPMAPGLAIMFNDRVYERCKDIARMLAGARGTTPPHLVDKQHACFAVVVNSITWGLNPFQVAASTYETPGGKVGYEGKLVQAILENSGRFEGPITFEHFGDWRKVQGRWKKPDKVPIREWKDEDEVGLGVIVRGKVKGESKEREFTMYLRECFPRNSTLWVLRPSQQICYTAVRAFGNIAAPGIMMGVPFNSDLDEAMIDVTPGDAPARPRRDNFVDRMGSGSISTDAQTDEIATGEAASEDDAVLAQAQDADAASEEFSTADAYQMGEEAFSKGKALRAVPPEWRDNPATVTYVEAWQEGWRAAEAEANGKK